MIVAPLIATTCRDRLTKVANGERADVDTGNLLCTINDPREILIAIGLTSGLGSIAYSVLALSSEPDLLWWEVMPGPRKRRNVSASRRYHAHKLMLDMIFDRWPPTVIALGPRSTDDEPIEWVTFMRTAIFSLGQAIRVPVVLFDTDLQIALGMGVEDTSRGLKTLVRQQMPTFNSNKRRVIVATAAAIAGATQVRNTLSREERAV